MRLSNRRILKCVFIMLFCASTIAAKAIGSTDSLQLKSYQYLIDQVDVASSRDTALQYVGAWIQKSKKEFNYEQLSLAYTARMHLAAQSLKLTYCDSILNAARQSGNKALVGSALISRGIIYYKKRHY